MLRVLKEGARRDAAIAIFAIWSKLRARLFIARFDSSDLRPLIPVIGVGIMASDSRGQRAGASAWHVVTHSSKIPAMAQAAVVEGSE
jgi:hypothetical protein